MEGASQRSGMAIGSAKRRSEGMNSTKRAARVAGLLYLLVSIPFPFCVFYIPSRLVVNGDATATANKIRASELLFRVGFVGELICTVGFMFVVFALYRLLKGVNKNQALLMVSLFVVSVPLSFVSVLGKVGALTLLERPDFLSVFDPRQLDALAMALLKWHGSALDLAQIFWGIWLIPFGLLVYKSGFLPRILGVFLIIACFGYLSDSFTTLLFPAYAHMLSRYSMVLNLGELPIIFWLLIVGAKDQPLDARA
jgi:hypothetical protein